MAPPRMRGDGRKAKDPKKTFLRLLSYLKKYWYIMLAVMVCIVLTAVAQTNTSAALGSLVDDYIQPMVDSGSSDFSALMKFLIQIACIYVLGMLGSFFPLARFLDV